MVYGVWCMVYGVWCMVYGVWCMVYGVWCMVYGACSCTTITANSILTLTLTGNRCVNTKSVYQYEIINP